MCYYVFSKYAWVVPLKEKKGIAITNAFQIFLSKLGHNQSKIWVDKVVSFTIEP